MNTEIKIINVSYQDINSGAARAAFRIHSTINKFGFNLKISSKMRVIKKFSNNNSVIGGMPKNRFFISNSQKIINRISRLITRDKNYQHFSTAFPSTGLAKELNKLFFEKKIDIVKLHFLGDNTLSIREISKLRMPILWVLHDQWSFSGLEHYSQLSLPDLSELDYLKYLEISRKNSLRKLFKKPDFNKYFFQQKLKLWRFPKYAVAPSKWMSKCAKNSPIFQNAKIKVIPYPLDLELWSPIKQKTACDILNLSKNKKYILFGALGGTSIKRKGGDLLFKGIKKLNQIIEKDNWQSLEILIFGQSDGSIENLPRDIKVHNIGHINSDHLLKLYYSVATMFVLPSRQDNLPGTGIEAQACGTPVVAFKTCGMTDIVEHHITGALCKPFEIESLAYEMKWILENSSKSNELRLNARLRAEKLWSQEKIANEYKNFYQSIMLNEI